MRALLAVAYAFLAACNHYTVRKFANFDLAMAQPTTVTTPPVFHEQDVQRDRMPAFVSYAAVHGDFFDGSASWQAQSLRSQASDFRPDFLVYSPRGIETVGAMIQPTGFGFAYATPVQRPQGLVWCCRVTATCTGLRIDRNAMVTGVEESARASGIQEGDTVVSIDGAAVRVDNGQAPYEIQMLRLRPGDVVPIVWIRPGTGRMEGRLTMLPNREMAPGLQVLVAGEKRKPANDLNELGR